MFKKILVVLLILLTIAGIGGTVYFYKETETANNNYELLAYEYQVLQQSKVTVEKEPTMPIYIVNRSVETGDLIQEEDLAVVEVPLVLEQNNPILSYAEVDGGYYRCNLTKGTILSSDVIMFEDKTGTTYDEDLTFDYLPLGLEIGDYVDIRMILPYGEEFKVISHKRVANIVEGTNTIKMYFTEEEHLLWKSALIDLALYEDLGLSIYLLKYSDPGADLPAAQYYPVRSEMENMVAANPDIEDDTILINTQLRIAFDTMLRNVTQDDATKISGARRSESGDIEKASPNYLEKLTDGSDASKVPTPGDTLGDVSESLNNIGNNILSDYTETPNSSDTNINEELEDKLDTSDKEATDDRVFKDKPIE